MFKAPSGVSGCSQQNMWKVMTANCTQRKKRSDVGTVVCSVDFTLKGAYQIVYIQQYY